MTFLFAADLHMDPLIWKGEPEIRGDAHRSWAQIVDIARDRKVEAMVLGGDIFDRHPPPETVECFLSGLRLLEQAKIMVLAIQGQHGRSRQLPWTSIDPYVIDLNARKYEEVGPFVISGYDNMPPNQLREQLGALDNRVNVLVLHQMVRGMVPNFGGREIWDCDPEWVPEWVKLVLLGDYHSPVERRFKGCLFKYNGSTVLRAIDEPETKCVHIVNEDFSLETVQLETRRFKRYLLTQEKLSDGDRDELVKELQELPDESVVYFKHNPKLNMGELRSVNEKIHYVFRPVPVRVERQEVEIKDVPQITLRGCLDEILARDKDPSLYDFLVDLLTTEAPAETIAIHRQRCMEETNADVSEAEGNIILPAQES